MPLNAQNELEHEPPKKSDPAHASTANTDHTTSTGEKPTSLVEVVADTSFVPTLHDAPLAQKLKSYLLLLGMILACVVTLSAFDFHLFQTTASRQTAAAIAAEGPVAPPPPASLLDTAWEVGLMTAGVSAFIMGSFYVTGTAHLDYWSLVMEYGWYTLPFIAGVGLLFVRAKESSEYVEDLS